LEAVVTHVRWHPHVCDHQVGHMRIDDSLYPIRTVHLRHDLMATPGEQAGDAFPEQRGVVRDGSSPV